MNLEDLSLEESIEIQIIERLKSQLPVDICDVALHPDNPETYELIHPNAAVLVIYNGSTSDDEDYVMENRKITIEIIVLSRTLNDRTGVKRLLSAVRRLLTDKTFRIENKLLKFVDDSFNNYIRNIWSYSAYLTLELQLQRGRY